MNDRSVLNLIVVFILALLFAGCGGSTMEVKQPLEKSLSPFTHFAFSCETNVAEDVTEEITELEERVAEEVKSLALFDSVELGSDKEFPPGTLQVTATIMEIEKVSEGERFLLGAFAGQASMTIDVIFEDAATGETLGSFSITGESGGTGLSGGTSQAIDETATAIRDLIREHYN